MNLSVFVKNCENQITGVKNGLTFVPSDQRDRYRVYSLAKLFDLAVSAAEIEQMLLVAPGLYEGLLRAYHSLLKQRANALWWQRLEDAQAATWPASMRNAIEEVAQFLGVDPRGLADELDDAAYPRTRQIVTLIAQRNTIDDGSSSTHKSTVRLPRNGYANLGDLPGPDSG